MSRYLYEHLYLGHLYFETDSQRRAFRIVRSTTPSGKPIAPIATRRPYDDPGVARFFYRLEPEREALLAKTHMPYALSAARMAKYRSWFLDPAYTVTALPSYDADTASNPVVAFRDLPLDGRYRFMLDEAEYFVMNFIKGPVCRGQLALDVIEDRFWVFFVDPKVGGDAMVAELLARESSNLRLPAEWGSNSPALIPWLEFSKLEANYLREKSEWLERNAKARKDDLSTDLERRWQQSKRSVDRVPSLRQCDGGQGSGRRSAEDGVGHRLSAVRADLLPARGGLRRLRQRRRTS